MVQCRPMLRHILLSSGVRLLRLLRQLRLRKTSMMSLTNLRPYLLLPPPIPAEPELQSEPRTPTPSPIPAGPEIQPEHRPATPAPYSASHNIDLEAQTGDLFEELSFSMDQRLKETEMRLRQLSPGWKEMSDCERYQTFDA